MKKLLNRFAAVALGIGLSLGYMAWAQQSGSGLPGGSNFSTQIRLNSTSFGGVGPGSSGQVLTSNGAGMAPSYQAAAANPPGGSNTQVQFNNAGAFGGDADMTFVTDTLSISKVVAAGGGSSDVSLRFGSDVDTGFYAPTSTSINLVRDGSNVFTIGSSLGILSTGSITLSPQGGGAALTMLSSDATFGVPVYTPATASGGAGLRLPPGTAPSSPTNGDIWTTSAGLFVRVNGATVGPLSAGAAATTGTFTITWDDACTTSPTQAVAYTAVSNIVTWSVAAQSGGNCTSDSTDFEATSTSTVPVAIRPAQAQKLLVPKALNNGITTFACLVVQTDGTVRMEINDMAGGVQCNSTTAWTNSGTKNAGGAFATAITYNLQ